MLAAFRKNACFITTISVPFLVGLYFGPAAAVGGLVVGSFCAKETRRERDNPLVRRVFYGGCATLSLFAAYVAVTQAYPSVFEAFFPGMDGTVTRALESPARSVSNGRLSVPDPFGRYGGRIFLNAVSCWPVKKTSSDFVVIAVKRASDCEPTFFGYTKRPDGWRKGDRLASEQALHPSVFKEARYENPHP